MPVLVPTRKQGLVAFSGGAGPGPQGIQNTFFFNTKGHGIPRRDDLTGVRILEMTHAVQIPLNTILSQITGTKWSIRPPMDIEPTEAHQEAAMEIEEFLDGGFNANEESFSSLVKKWVGDILSIDAGVLELVPGEDNFLAEIYARDGISFTKNPDEHGRLPGPGSPEPAYWQFSLASTTGLLNPKDALFEIYREGLQNPGIFRPFNPIPFSRDQIVWTENYPRSWDVYGYGRLQVVRRLLDIILNEDLTNLSWFRANEVPEGFLQFIEASESEIERFRAYWNQEIRGKEHKMPIVGGKKAEWTPFRPTLNDLQFLDSQRWYHKLVWFAFGLSSNEVGEVEDVNLANGEEQSRAVWRKTTKPLLDLLAREINRKILPFLEAYHRVDGELEFAWEEDNPAIKALNRQRNREDLENALTTVNEVRQARGQEPLPWGDMTPQMVGEVTRQFPRWIMENWANIPTDDLPDEPLGGILGLGAEPDEVKVQWNGQGYDGLLATPAPLLKDALRNEPAHEYPAVKGIMEETGRQLGFVFQDARRDVLAAVEQRFSKSTSFDISAIIDGIDLTSRLRDAVVVGGLAAMKKASEFHASQAEKELQARLGDDAPEVAFEFEVEDSNAAKAMAARAAQRMVTVNETVKRLIRETLVQTIQVQGGNVTDATRELRRLFDDQLTDSHARLVARTEVLQSSRQGSQAFAESTPLIAGKGWRATKDGRTRAWHAAMDGTVVETDDVFIVPVVDEKQRGQGYPKRVMVVGEDQPFNCRCDQYPVLADDLPARLELGETPGLVRKNSPRFTEDLSPAQRNVLFAYGAKDEEFASCIRRLHRQAGSMHALSRKLGMPRSTLYGWLPTSDN